MPESPARWYRWLALSAVILVLDLATKSWISQSFQLGESRYVTPFFNLVLAHNAGAAFSFLAGAGGWQRWFFVVVTIVVSAVLLAMLRKGHANRLLATALALVLGGAAGNLWDRATLGYVVDFLQVHGGGYYFPAFNVADSAITIGVILLLWDSFRGEPGARERPAMNEPIEILLAKPRGFCAGVDRAIAIVERALALHGAPIYVRHEIVHNKFVVEDLRAKGAVFVEELDEVPPGATVIFSAHGVSLAVRARGRGARPQGVRRHLPAGDQGPRRGRRRCASRAARS